MPAGKIGANYSQNITASGGLDPYAFSVTSGGLPAGLTLSGGGTLSGTPTAATVTNLTVTASASGCSGNQSYTLTISPPDPAHFDSITLLPDNNIHLTISGSSNVNYDIQASTDLSAWGSLISTGNSTGIFDYSDLNATNFVDRFYRAVWVP